MMLPFRLAAVLLPLMLATGAAAAERAIIVLDASGSMWGEINGAAKMTIARDTLRSVLGKLPDTLELGLIAYGHRDKGRCDDIELLVPPATGTGAAIAEAAAALSPKGKTPISEAVKRAAEGLRYTEEKATVILITDGIETCDADPCAVATALEQAGVDLTVHVVGFGLSSEEGAKVACLAENTGGTY
jgi:Ca-activated chloride channel family protein